MRQYRLLIAGGLVICAVAAIAMPGRAAERKRHEAKPAVANPPPAHEIGSAGPWNAYVAGDRTGKVCYLVGRAEKSLPASARRQPPSAMVTHRPKEHVFNVVSFVEGYPLKAGSDVRLDVGPRKFELFTNGDAAWARTSDLDKEIVETLAKGRDAVAHGIPAHGAATTDTYSLVGFSKALGMIDKACDVRR
ncbi:MAG TPA: invasion associated locus B family protein [Stellaceae bacterium]|nr:invasion associated locus B family protein [Stellaceae bacterium]